MLFLLLRNQISKSEANSGVMRLIVGGGRAAESAETKGAVIVGVRTLSEGGRVGNFSREQVRKQEIEYYILFFHFNILLSCMIRCHFKVPSPRTISSPRQG